jgi:hypothetical protein
VAEHDEPGGGEDAAPETTIGEGRGYAMAGLVMAGLAIALVPPLFGLIGAAFGFVGWRKGDPLGLTAIKCSVAASILGVVVSAIVFQVVT